MAETRAVRRSITSPILVMFVDPYLFFPPPFYSTLSRIELIRRSTNAQTENGPGRSTRVACTAGVIDGQLSCTIRDVLERPEHGCIHHGSLHRPGEGKSIDHHDQSVSSPPLVCLSSVLHLTLDFR